MQLTVHDLTQQLSTHRVELIAGEQGLHRRVSLAHIVENLEIAKFLQGGEIVFINGVALGSELSLLDLTDFIFSKDIGALILCIGPYIPSIDQAVIDLANQHSIPLFSSPWDVYCANLLKDISQELIESETEMTSTTERILNAALLGDVPPQVYQEQLEEKGWNPHGTYCVAVVQGEILSNTIFNRLHDSLSRCLNAQLYASGHLYNTVHIKGRLAVVFCDLPEPLLLTTIAYMDTICAQEKEVQLVLGNRVSGMDMMPQSYANAMKILPHFQVIHSYEGPTDAGFIDYEALRLYKILLSIDNHEVLKTYCQATIAPLLQYDAVRGSSLCTTLKDYMHHNGSVIRVAEDLFAHRNTISKQLNKIETILQVDLSDWQVRNQLMLGFYAQDLL